MEISKALGTVSPEETRYREQLHQTPAGDRDAAKLRTTLVAPALLVLYGLVMPWLLLHWYVRPYQRGNDELMPDGSIDWTGAEALFALSPALLFVPLGVISLVVIWRRYHPLD